MPVDFYAPTTLTEIRKEILRLKWLTRKELFALNRYKTYQEFYRMRRSQINRLYKEVK